MNTPPLIQAQIEANKQQLEGEGFRVFDGAEDCHRILQNLCYHPSPAPMAIFCEQCEGASAIGYLNFVPNDYSSHEADGMVEIKGTSNGQPRTIYVHYEQNYGMTGDIVSLVAIPNNRYPAEFLASFPEPLESHDQPPRARRAV